MSTMLRLIGYRLFLVLIVAIISIIWCEYGYYYFTFNVNCGDWPHQVRSNKADRAGINFTRLMVIADTHIMGPRKSFRLDKLIREWEMKRSFKISHGIYKPDTVIYLGDMLDEGQLFGDQEFYQACNDFDDVFTWHHNSYERIVVAGNHDVGYHNRILVYPYLMQRYQYRFDATTDIRLVRIGETNLVFANSMSFYNDTCTLCSESQHRLDKIMEELSKDGNEPILFSHIPLYRYDDTLCEYPNSIKDRVKQPNVEGRDVIHRSASIKILDSLKPRLTVSGHSHMYCDIHHSIGNNRYRELTISSYSHKYAELKPGFLLLSANSTHLFTKHCDLPSEWIVVTVYLAAILLVIMILAKTSLARRVNQ